MSERRLLRHARYIHLLRNFYGDIENVIKTLFMNLEIKNDFNLKILKNKNWQSDTQT